MQARRRSPLLRLINRSAELRLLLSALLAAALLGLVNRYENCHRNHYSSNCLSTNAADVISIGNVESFSIVTAAILYLLDGGRRRQEHHQRLAEAVESSRQRGDRVSLGRIEALETLSRDGLWLDGQNLAGIQLEGLVGAGGRWREVCFRGSDLNGADFRRADLQGADLADCNLRGADLREADLRHADLRMANLSGARLEGALLDGARLEGAQLEGHPGLQRSTGQGA